MARLFRSYGKSALRPPQVVSAAQTFSGKVNLAVDLGDAVRHRVSQRAPTSRLRPPVVVGGGIAWHGPGTYLVYPLSPNFLNPRAVHSRLRPPIVVRPDQVEGDGKRKLRVYLVAVQVKQQAGLVRRQPYSKLRPPVVVSTGGVFFGPHVTLTRIRPPRVTYDLAGPIVVFPFLGQLGGIGISLAPSSRGKAKSRLSPPAVLTATGIFFGPSAHLQRIRPVKTEYRLSPPTVVFPFFPRELPTALAPQRRGTPKSRLEPPVVIDLRPQVFYISTTLARIRPAHTISFLKPPTDTVGLEDRGRVDVTLAPQSRGKPKSRLEPPTVIDLTPQVKVVSVTLAASFRGVPKSHLFPAPISAAAVIYYGPTVTLTYSERGTPKSNLSGPVVIFPFFPRDLPIALAPQRRGTPKSRLEPPVVIDLTPQVYYLSTTFVRIKPPPTLSFLRPPQDTVGIEDQGHLDVTLAPQRRGKAKSRLAPPVVTDISPQVKYLSVNLSPSTRGKPKSKLLPPALIDLSPQVFYLSLTLARIRPQPTLALLKPPADITEAEEFPVARVHLAYSKRGAPKSRLAPPTVVAPVVSYGPAVELAPSFRGTPKSRLSPPTIVNPVVTFFTGPKTHLSYSSRGKPKFFLRPPVVIFPFFARQTSITLAPQARGVPKSHLSPPTILKTSGTLQVTLAYSRRGKPRSFLLPPKVVFLAVEIYGPEIHLTRIKPVPTISLLRAPTDVSDAQDVGLLKTHLTYSRRGKASYQLKPPTVIERVFSLGPETHLAASLRGKPRFFLKPPTVVTAAFSARAIQVHLTRIKPVRTLALLKKPTLVGEPERYFGPQVTLVRIKHPPVLYFKVVSEFVPFVPPRGDVCGFDIAGSFVCELQLPGSQVSGADSSGHQVTGSSSAGSKITGSESQGGSVSGSDRKAT